MKEQIIDGVRVLDPQTPEELEQAVESGRPFLAPEKLAEEFGLPTDPHIVDGEDAGVLYDDDQEGEA